MKTVSKLLRSLRAFKQELARNAPETGPGPEGIPVRPLIGLALGGGFARGLAHIGALKILEEEQIPIDFIAGTSVGAVIGAAYCSGVSAKEMEEVAHLVRFKDFARWTLSRLGLASNDRMAGFLHRLLKVKTFEELRIPLAVAATDFETGDGVVFRSGPLVEAVRASCAYPGIFLPVRVNGRLLIDGMLAHAVPTHPLREMGAERVLAIYLSAHWVNLQGPRHVFDVVGQCFSIAQAKMCGLWQSGADLIVTPDVRGFSYDGFERAPELIRAGYEATRLSVAEVKAWLPQRVAVQPAAREKIAAAVQPITQEAA